MIDPNSIHVHSRMAEEGEADFPEQHEEGAHVVASRHSPHLASRQPIPARKRQAKPRGDPQRDLFG